LKAERSCCRFKIKGTEKMGKKSVKKSVKKKKRREEKSSGRWQRAVIGILMALIMIGSVIAMMLQI